MDFGLIYGDFLAVWWRIRWVTIAISGLQEISENIFQNPEIVKSIDRRPNRF